MRKSYIASCFFIKLTLFFFLLALWDVPAKAEINSIVPLAKKTLVLNSHAKDYDARREVFEKLADVKEFIQMDFKNGNPHARIDVFLLLDGLIQNDLNALESFLSTPGNNALSKDFADVLDYDYAEQLAFASKENKHQLLTEYEFIQDKGKEKCQNYVNGYHVPNNSSFMAPSGLVLYVGSYCPDNSFSIAKIQSEKAQPHYDIRLRDFVLSEMFPYNTLNKKEKNIALSYDGEEGKKINNFSQAFHDKENKKSTNVSSFRENINTSNNIWSVQSGVGMLGFLPFDNQATLYNTGENLFTFLNLTLQYQAFFFSLDFANLIEKNSGEITRRVVPGTHYIEVSDTIFEEGLFWRPAIGYSQTVYQWNECWNFNVSGDVGLIFLTGFDKSRYQKTGVGLRLTPSVSWQEGNLFFKGQPELGYYSFSNDGLLTVGALLTAGWQFKAD